MSHFSHPSHRLNRPLKRYSINPVEFIVFIVVLAVFLNSTYRLFFDPEGFRPTALVAMSSNPLSEGRALASQVHFLTSYEVSCEEKLSTLTHSSKVRLNGRFCNGSSVVGSRLIKAEIVNHTNQYSATVFSNTLNNNFSTDYIPLTEGENKIKILFSFIGGESTEQELLISKD